jgi:hypothetical protein
MQQPDSQMQGQPPAGMGQKLGDTGVQKTAKRAWSIVCSCRLLAEVQQQMSARNLTFMEGKQTMGDFDVSNGFLAQSTGDKASGHSGSGRKLLTTIDGDDCERLRAFSSGRSSGRPVSQALHDAAEC